MMTKKCFEFRPVQRLFLGWVGVLLCGFLGAGCDRPSNLVLVNVIGLDPRITELHVTLTLDGAVARNQQPSDDDPDAHSFSVYKDMDRFGIEISTPTQQLGVHIDGLNTSRVVVKTADGQLDLNQQRDLDVMLHTP